MTKILLVGHALEPRGYTTPAQYILQQILAERGLRMKDVDIAAPAMAGAAIRRLRPNIVVALGDYAAKSLIPGYDSSCMQTRGYFYNVRGTKVLVTVHPELVATTYTPWRFLLSSDIQRAKDDAHTSRLTRPTRSVHVVNSPIDARRCVRELVESRRLAFDIEIFGPTELSCVGFATASNRAIVFPPSYFREAFEVLRHPVAKVAQNGQFDLHFLLTRCDVRVEGYVDDTLIAWHSCYPEFAGASVDSEGNRKGGAKMTRKSLSFLASMFCYDAWWKDYEFKNHDEMYVLNGRDCCITYDIMETLDREIDSLQVRDIYNHEISLVWPCVEMQARGLHIDEALRASREAALRERLDSANERLNELVLPLLEQHIDTLPERVANLFRWRNVCDCCRNGAGKRDACWSCAGFEKKPGKRELTASGISLDLCTKCQGRGDFTGLAFNANSTDQKRAILYDILRLPKKTSRKKRKDGRVEDTLSTDEDSLKSLLAHVL